jgi:hypothetical protein
MWLQRTQRSQTLVLSSGRAGVVKFLKPVAGARPYRESSFS